MMYLPTAVVRRFFNHSARCRYSTGKVFAVDTNTDDALIRSVSSEKLVSLKRATVSCQITLHGAELMYRLNDSLDACCLWVVSFSVRRSANVR
jgi:hypothetical protein